MIINLSSKAEKPQINFFRQTRFPADTAAPAQRATSPGLSVWGGESNPIADRDSAWTRNGR